MFIESHCSELLHLVARVNVADEDLTQLRRRDHFAPGDLVSFDHHREYSVGVVVATKRGFIEDCCYIDEKITVMWDK